MRASHVDLVVLVRDDAPLHPDVQRGIESQAGVQLTVHRVIGRPIPGELSRLPAIVRARNEGKRFGTSPWLMFLDDDVVLAPNTVGLLLGGLCAQPRFAALGADYLNESRGVILSRHVGMGAVLFRRSALEKIQFRSAPDKCECLCCCQDLRRKGMRIGYHPAAQARHLPPVHRNQSYQSHQAAAAANDRAAQTAAIGPVRAYVLAAFDRRHNQKFQHRFLSSLRAAGNHEPVLAFAYGLYPSEQPQLKRLPGVELIPMPSSDVAVPIRRLRDFQGPLRRLPPGSVVAYWDAGDVIFQDRLAELWTLARNNPDRLLVVAEPFGHPQNDVVARWTLSIHDPSARKYAYELLTTRPYFNAGFAAATVPAMLRYLQTTDALLHSNALRGTTDWGDQTAMNLYCHSNSDCFLAVDERWNYCICGRPALERVLRPDGRFVRKDARPISVVHGNGASFVPYAELAPVALARSSATARSLV